MSLLAFHRVLIASGIVFCAGFSAWQLYGYRQAGGALDLAVGLGFAAAAGLLGVYLVHLRRFLRLPPRPARATPPRPH